MDVTTNDADLLERGSDKPPRRGRSLAALAVLLVMAGVWSVDRHERAMEFGQVMRCVRTGQAAVADADARTAAMSGYIRPALSSGPSPEVSAGLFLLVARAAEQALPGLDRAERGCRSVAPALWHSRLRAALRAYLVLLDSRLTSVAAVSRQGSDVYVDQPEQRRLERLARAALLAAAPDQDAARLVRSVLGASVL